MLAQAPGPARRQGFLCYLQYHHPSIDAYLRLSQTVRKDLARAIQVLDCSQGWRGVSQTVPEVRIVIKLLAIPTGLRGDQIDIVGRLCEHKTLLISPISTQHS